eukprot:SAG11_NODE_3818_length_2210_cov_2.614874_1_plen_319_part_00
MQQTLPRAACVEGLAARSGRPSTGVMLAAEAVAGQRPRSWFTSLGRTVGAVGWDRLRQSSGCVVEHNYRTFSKFFRDPKVFEFVLDQVLRGFAKECALAVADASSAPLRCWSLGCSAGEEAYSVVMLWEEAIQRSPARVVRRRPAWLATAPPEAELHRSATSHTHTARWTCRAQEASWSVLGTDISPSAVEAARRASYTDHATQDVPRAWLARCFERRADGSHVLAPGGAVRSSCRFEVQDVKGGMPQGERFDLIVCRYAVFLYLSFVRYHRRATRLLPRARHPVPHAREASAALGRRRAGRCFGRWWRSAWRLAVCC